MSTALTPHPDYVWNAESIRGLRKHLRMSQSAFSRQLGVRQQTVSEWETGVYEPRGASSTLLSMIASSAGYGVQARPNAAERTPQHIASSYSNGRVDTSRMIGAPARYDTAFPPAAPSTEREAFAAENRFSARATPGPDGDFFGSRGQPGFARREVPM